MSDDSLEIALNSSHMTRDLQVTKFELLEGVVDLDAWEIRERYSLTRELLGDGNYGCVVKVSFLVIFLESWKFTLFLTGPRQVPGKPRGCHQINRYFDEAVGDSH